MKCDTAARVDTRVTIVFAMATGSDGIANRSTAAEPPASANSSAGIF